MRVRVIVDKSRLWTAPFPAGEKEDGEGLSRGEEATIVNWFQSEEYTGGQLANGYWINLWSLYNKNGLPVGIWFVVVLS